jgi:hypothetical protein
MYTLERSDRFPTALAESAVDFVVVILRMQTGSRFTPQPAVAAPEKACLIWEQSTVA